MTFSIMPVALAVALFAASSPAFAAEKAVPVIAVAAFDYGDSSGEPGDQNAAHIPRTAEFRDFAIKDIVRTLGPNAKTADGSRGSADRQSRLSQFERAISGTKAPKRQRTLCQTLDRSPRRSVSTR